MQGYLADTLFLVGFASTPFFHGVREYVKGYQVLDKLHLNLETTWLNR